MYVFKRDLIDEGDGAYLTLFVIECQTEEEAKENERSSSVTLLSTMNSHVSNIARTFYFELRRLASIRRFLTSTATATLVSAFALSRIDYSNSMLFGSTHDVTSQLQRIQNYAARVILRLPKSSSITTHLKSFHWLTVNVRRRRPSHIRNTRSSSYTMPLLNRPAHSKATLGDPSFSFATTSVWNSITNDAR